jgi:GntR family transcriptional regulator
LKKECTRKCQGHSLSYVLYKIRWGHDTRLTPGHLNAMPAIPTPPATAFASDIPGLLVTPGQAPAFSPLYQQIKGLILQSLQSGEWKPGEAIPSEMDLAARFKVSQGTVRKAIDELATENLLVRRQGKGTFVATHAEERFQFRFLKLHPDHGNPQSQGPAQRTILACKRLRASAEVARALALRTGEPVIEVRRTLAFGGVPTILEELWLPGDRFKGLSAERLAASQGPMYAMFEAEFGISMVRADERLRAVLPDEQQAQWLQVSTNTPLLSVERVAFTYNDLPMELRRGLYRTDMHHYRNQLF